MEKYGGLVEGTFRGLAALESVDFNEAMRGSQVVPRGGAALIPVIEKSGRSRALVLHMLQRAADSNYRGPFSFARLTPFSPCP